VLHGVWGRKLDRFLERSIASLELFHADLPFHVERLPDDATLLDKARMLDLAPFEETLFLDIDTVVLGRPDFGFEKAIKHDLA
jgi:hypothetical protein